MGKLEVFSDKNIDSAPFDKFINRIGGVVVFHALDEKNIKSIERIQAQLENPLARHILEGHYQG